MIEAVLWDNDGVLVDTESLFFETTRAAFARLNLELTSELWGRQFLGQGKSSRDIACSLGGAPDSVARMLEQRNQQYQHVLGTAPAVRPHVPETLERLYGKVRMAIVTGCHRDQLELMHRSSGLLRFFEVIVTGDQCSQAKPDPEAYLAALRLMQLSAGRCLAIEDSPRGLAAARAAGIPCMIVPTELTRTQPFPGALALERDVSAVIKHLGALSRDGGDPDGDRPSSGP